MRRVMKTSYIAILGGGGIPNKQGKCTTFVRDYRYDNGHHRGPGQHWVRTQDTERRHINNKK